MAINKVVLIIMDGWGYAPSWGGNAISQARTPYFDKLWRSFPRTLLKASGEAVGLPTHERGNSEVGHLNLGAGRIVKQDISYINEQLSCENLANNKIMDDLIDYAVKNQSNIHLLGLVSDGGIHSHINHLLLLIQYLSQKQEIKDKVYIHAFTDGRDNPTQKSLEMLSGLNNQCIKFGCGKVASISGRYFAMDRDNHWERIKLAYDAMVNGVGMNAKTPLAAISQAYLRGETDEFIRPTVIADNYNRPISIIKNKDVVIYFNFRSDRARQLTIALNSKNFKNFKQNSELNEMFFVNMVPYGVEQEIASSQMHSLFSFNQSGNCLAKVLSDNNIGQLHIAETEKYAHVTYFFNGGKEEPYNGEERIVIPSPKVSTYDQVPEMSAREVTAHLLGKIKNDKYRFSLVNFANADMVGHTGNFKAIVRACECVDEQVGKILTSIDEETAVIITADHGNAEQSTNPKTGEPDTEHTRNPVPCILYAKDLRNFAQGDWKLGNIGASVLDLLNLPIPQDMIESIFLKKENNL